MQIILLFTALYFLPGFILSRITSGKLKNNFIFWLFLSCITVPFIYQFLAYSRFLTLFNYISILIFLSLLIYFLNLKSFIKLNLDKIFLNGDSSRGIFTWLAFFFLGIFLLMLLLPRIGLWEGKFPIGDDRHRMGKIVSIAESPDVPLFYRFPVTPLTIYYFDQVQPGLMVKFSNNALQTHQSWVIHNFLRGLVLVWLIWMGVRALVKDPLGRLAAVMGLTFFGGLEFYLKMIKRVDINHIEWWTDWWGKEFYIHMQISNPFTLAFWVPQHFLAGLLTIPLYLLLISKEKESILGKILISAILAAILGYSAFVFLTVVVALALYFLIRIFLKEEGLIKVIKDNFLVGIISLLMAAPLIYLFATADKESYFSFGLNSFHFLDNSSLPLKVINFLLTIPYFLIVELGLLSLVFAWSIFIFFRDKLWRSTLLFWYLMLLPLGLLFITKAADDNNISMRSTIPSLVGLAFFAGLSVTPFVSALKRLFHERLIYIGLTVAIILSSSAVLAEFYFRFNGQFTEVYSSADPIFRKIDSKVPLNSIIFTQQPLYDSVTALSHRFTFKPLFLFNPTDKEYASYKKIKHLEKELDIIKLLKANPRLNGYELYHLVYLDKPDVDDKSLESLEILERSGGLILYRLKGIEEAVAKE